MFDLFGSNALVVRYVVLPVFGSRMSGKVKHRTDSHNSGRCSMKRSRQFYGLTVSGAEIFVQTQDAFHVSIKGFPTHNVTRPK